MMKKKVGVIIPTYKRPLCLPRAIESVLSSTWENTEIIVVDDNNEGDEYRVKTEVLMKDFLEKHDNIKYIKHQVNKNGSAARNTGIKNSSGDYLMFLDDDDEFYPEKISKQVEFLDTHSNEWGACYTKYVDVAGGRVVSTGIEKQEGYLLMNELARNLFVHAGSNLMVRRDVVLELEGFDETFLRNQDVEFLVRILKKYKLGYVNYLGLAVNVHPKNYTVDYFELTDMYVNRFRDEINSLDERGKEAIFRMIALQKAKQAIKEKNIMLAWKFIRKNKVSQLTIIQYLLHLLRRTITKTSYGFPMNRLYQR